MHEVWDLNLALLPAVETLKDHHQSPRILRRLTIVETVGNLARGDDFSLSSVGPMNGLVMAQAAVPPQACQTVVDGNKYLLKTSDQSQ